MFVQSSSVPAGTFVSQFIFSSFLSHPASDERVRFSTRGFQEKSHTCGSHHSLTSEDIATDVVERAGAHGHFETCAHSAGPTSGCVDVGAPLAGASPQLATKGHDSGQTEQTFGGGSCSKLTNSDLSDVRRLHTTDLVSINEGGRSTIGTGGNASTGRPDAHAARCGPEGENFALNIDVREFGSMKLS